MDGLMMDNRQFLRSLGITEGETLQKCLNAMHAYGENRWWEPGVDKRLYAYYQLHETYLLGTWHYFHEAVELLLGRPVFTHEFGLPRLHATLLAEAKQAKRRMDDE